MGYNPWRQKESERTKQIIFSRFTSIITHEWVSPAKISPLGSRFCVVHFNANVPQRVHTPHIQSRTPQLLLRAPLTTFFIPPTNCTPFTYGFTIRYHSTNFNSSIRGYNKESLYLFNPSSKICLKSASVFSALL